MPNRIKIDWLDGDISNFDEVLIYQVDKDNKLATIIYRDNNKTENLLINLLAVSCILYEESDKQ